MEPRAGSQLCWVFVGAGDSPSKGTVVCLWARAGAWGGMLGVTAHVFAPWQPLSRKQATNRSRSSINIKNFRKFNARRKWKVNLPRLLWGTSTGAAGGALPSQAGLAPVRL